MGKVNRKTDLMGKVLKIELLPSCDIPFFEEHTGT